MTLNTIGYPFNETELGLFNPISDLKQNAKGKLLNLLSTMRGQRILSYNCQFGVDLYGLLFQNMKYSDGQKNIQLELKKQIKRWIPQIQKLNIVIEKLQDSYVVNIEFSVNEQFDTLSLEININE